MTATRPVALVTGACSGTGTAARSRGDGDEKQ
jgi:NAD(P)-dependent dehydrogenase (short-subunit alcohol dehydrogenase family)